MEKLYTRDQIKDAIWQELKESDYTGENNDRAYEVIGIVMAGIDKIGGEAQTGAVWVKASERYPEKDDKYFIRQNGAKSAANLWQYTKEYWQTTEMEWLDESAPSGEREGDAVAFNIYCTDSYYYENGFWWHKENHDPYSVDQLYDIFKQQKEG